MQVKSKRRVISWMIALVMTCSVILTPTFNVYGAETMTVDQESSSLIDLADLGTVTSGPAIGVKVLDANELTQEDIVEDKLVADYFTIAAATGKNVTIDGHDTTANDGTAFTQRIKLNGTGTMASRSIRFTTTEKTFVEIYAQSGSSSADRVLNLHKDDGSVIGTADAKGKELVKSTIILEEAGSYYVVSPSSGVNVYLMRVTPGDPPAAADRPEWDTVAAPVITSVEYKKESDVLQVDFTLDISLTGADKAIVEMQDEEGNTLDSKIVGQTSDPVKTVEFKPTKSGIYHFVVKAERDDEESPIVSDRSVGVSYTLPLTKTIVNAYNKGAGDILVKWISVLEAEQYKVEYKEEGGQYVEAGTVEALELEVPGLTVGKTYTIRVTAIRGADEMLSDELVFTVEDKEEMEWAFTYFGQSSNKALNTFEMIDSEDLTFKLNSCSVKSDGTIDKKGGKFTTFHDGISFYYTPIDPKTENFELTATFTLDFINGTPDGQEGFGLIAMDSLGDYGVSNVNHYTNSASIIATKFDLKKPDGSTILGLKDVIGTRFVSGMTPEVLNGGDSAIAQSARNVSEGYNEELVKQGERYTLTLKKTNTGYHMILDGDLETERIMYNPDKLLQLDPENVYVGFAVARGCNVTVSDVSMKITDPATDPEALPEPIQKVDLVTKIDSPTEVGNPDYTFVFNANADGKVKIQDAQGNIVAEDDKVTANKDYTKGLSLVKGNNEYNITFYPDEDYVTEEGFQLHSYDPVDLKHNIAYKAFAGTTLFVSPNGKPNGLGTKKSPLDIYTATKYVAKGQIIALEGGTYNMPSKLVIPRGINGTEKDRITLKSQQGSRAVLNFKDADGGMQLWSDYWHIYGIDVCETPGNIKGLQIAGHNNIVEFVNTYRNGDTGLQISGTGSETYDKWPSNNLILNCTSYDNIDPGENNADGFAAKITTGPGNVFRGCMAHNNLDDGWDLFAKIESGPIGAVVVEDSLAFSNGTLTNGYGNGDGNGFKLGGDGIAVPHILRNSISFNNNTNGITSNSDPDIILENNTAYGNKGANISLYGKGNGDRNFVATNNISMKGKGADNYSEMPSLASENNYFFDGTRSVNSLGVELKEDIFVNVDMSIMPTRTEEGFIQMHGLLELNDQAIEGIGAIILETRGPIDVAIESELPGDSGSSGGGGGGGGSTSSEPKPVTSTNGKGEVHPVAGGTIGVSDKATVKIPKGALKGTKALQITVEKVSKAAAIDAAKNLISEVYEFKVGDYTSYQFDKEVEITLSIDKSKLAKGMIPAIHYYDEDAAKWINIGGKVSGDTITVKVDHFTKFAVLGIEETVEETVKETIELKDIKGHWAEDSILKLIEMGSVGGYPDGTFRPQDNITRAEFTKILVESLNLTMEKGKAFTDTSNHWAKEYIEAASFHGIIGGYDDDRFGPNDYLTREQMATIMVNAVGAELTSTNNSFVDNKDISNWAKAAVNTAVKEGIMLGLPDNSFKPKALASRAEAVVVIARVLK